MGRVTLYFLLSTLAYGQLTGCTDNTSSGLWEDYTSRIGNIFEAQIPDVDKTSLGIDMPTKKQRLQVLQPPNISLLQFLKLYQCPVNSLVAQRNGPLGKVMLPSQTLIYVSQFLPLAKQCLDNESINEENANALNQAIDFYQDNKAAYFSNALFHDEFSGLFHAAHLWPMGEHFPATGVPGLDTWRALQEQMQDSAWPQTHVDANALESALRDLDNNPLAGQWLQEIHIASQYLAAMTQQMKAHKGLCIYSQQSVKKTALLNVFRLWFTQKIQPWVSQLSRFGNAFNGQLNALTKDQAVMHGFYQDLFAHTNSPWQQFKRQWQAHVKAWQRHLNQCQSMPGQTP
jgi:hypothetical protein